MWGNSLCAPITMCPGSRRQMPAAGDTAMPGSGNPVAKGWILPTYLEGHPLTPDSKRIGDKIIKLLALANSSTFAGEAETARRMAEELMQMHNAEPWIKTAQDGIEMRKHVSFAKGM